MKEVKRESQGTLQSLNWLTVRLWGRFCPTHEMVILVATLQEKNNKL